MTSKPSIKVAIVDDYEAYAELLAGPLLREGHGVMVELAPVDFERILHFAPNVISLGLYRRKEAFSRPIVHFEEDVVGFQPLVDMERYPAINLIPIVLIGMGLVEEEVPTSLNYDLFLTFPDDLHLYLPKVEELATIVKTRRKISGYVCPVCRSRLVYVRRKEDLFCPRCGTSVAIVDPETCLFSPGGDARQTQRCTLAQITAPAPIHRLFQKEVLHGPGGTGELYRGDHDPPSPDDS